MSQYQLADETGIHRAQIGAWEAEKHSPTFSSIERMAIFFGVDVLRFLAGPTAPQPGTVVELKDLVEVGLFEGISPLMRDEPTGAMLIPRALRGCVAVEVTEKYPGWRRMAPELRVGDIWAFRLGGRPRDGALVAVMPKDSAEGVERVPTGGLYRSRTKTLEAFNPSYPSLPLEDFDVVGVGEALLWRDYRQGARR
jgi:transcriptional regulator with XRE-family HTH domain